MISGRYPPNSLRSAKLQAMHKAIGVVREAHHHKDLGDLSIRISKLLHGSGVELQSGGAVIEG